MSDGDQVGMTTGEGRRQLTIYCLPNGAICGPRVKSGGMERDLVLLWNYKTALKASINHTVTHCAAYRHDFVTQALPLRMAYPHARGVELKLASHDLPAHQVAPQQTWASARKRRSYSQLVRFRMERNLRRLTKASKHAC